MSENLDSKRQFILEDKDGSRWLFFLSSNNHILYFQLKKGDKTQNNMVDSQPVRDFYATIDKNGTIMLLAYTLSRQLIYYEWVNNRWERQVLERIYSRFQNIPYICILSSSDSIHILYYIESSLAKSAESLVHYYLQGGKWYGGRLWKFISDEETTPRTAFIDPKNNLHIAFTKRRKNSSLDIFHACFHSNSLSWTGPSSIHTTAAQCNQFQLYVDADENIHLIWRENIDRIFRLKHLYQKKKDPALSWNEAILYQSSHEISWPTLVHGNELICLWLENKTLYQMKSLDSGRSWSQPHSLAETPGDQLGLLNYISHNKNEFPAHTIALWGQGYPDIRIAGIDLFEVSRQSHYSYQAGQFPERLLYQDYSSQWAEAKEAISMVNKETKQLKTQIANLSAQINQLYSAVYELQDHMKLKEKSIFAIQTEMKRLGFEINKIYQRSRHTPIAEAAKKSAVPETAEIETTAPVESAIEEINSNQNSESTKDSSGETEKIILGNTTILINPEDSES